MQEITTDLWSLLLPEEWQAEQDEETIVVFDDDEVSSIEITPVMPENGMTVAALLASMVDKNYKQTVLAELPAYYGEFVEEDMFWREWFCDAGEFVLILSHGTESENKGMDDGVVNEILDTLFIQAGEEEGAAE